LADRLLTTYKQKISRFELEPSGGGCFEVSLDGELIFSKLESGRFPDEDEILKEAARRLAA
jgi:selenoprotein W-related protein